jgi:hypothetical protein
MDGYTVFNDGLGWTGLTVIGGHLHRLRGGGKRGGPRSVAIAAETGEQHPGVYARNITTGLVSELVPFAVHRPVPLDLIDVLPFGHVDVDGKIPGWVGWGDEPPTLTGYELTPDPMDTEEAHEP